MKIRLGAYLAAIDALSERSPFAMNDGPRNYSIDKKQSKECKFSKCNNKHNHNNACCCADHYRMWRKEVVEKDK